MPFSKLILVTLLLVQALPAHAQAKVAQFAPHAMIASNSTPASAAGIEILKRGGNAVDAAVATGFALAVTLPEAGNIGGGGYMVIRMSDGRTAALDYRETAPQAATRNMYLGSTGAITNESIIGYKAAGIPGSVAGMYEAHKRYGKLPWKVVLAPAIKLAQEGFVVDTFTYIAITKSTGLIKQFAGKDVFLPNGQAPAIGLVLKQPALAKTLRRIATGGANAFYRGTIAREIVQDMKSNGGLITMEDLASYKPIWQKPVITRYRGHTVIGMPLSSSGGITMSKVLATLDTSTSLPPYGSTSYFTIMRSALKAAFHYRNTQLGDTAAMKPIQQREGTETTHYSVVDKYGNAVSTTTTINSLFGAGAYVAQAGFFLNNEMDDFAAKPGVPNQFGLVMGEANAIAPGKRPLSSMSPTIVLDPKDSVLLVAGSRGGPRIITSTLQVIMNVIDYKMTLSEAMQHPRLHYQELPDTLFVERGALTPVVTDSLAKMGVTVGITSGVGLVDAVMRTNGGWLGMDDPRRQVQAVGY